MPDWYIAPYFFFFFTMISRPRGTRDFLPDEMRRRRDLEKRMRAVFERWGYEEVATPTFEHLELFTLKSGDAIIEELYEFADKGGRGLALRPELTAPVIRMYINEMKNAPMPLKLYYFGNCFRYERPQRGRFREFWQFGCELIGTDTPEAEAEVIALASTIMDEVGVKQELHIGDLAIVRDLLGDLSQEEQSMIMRLMDKKDEAGLREVLDADIADKLFDLIEARSCDEIEALMGASDEMEHLRRVLDLLDVYGVKYQVDLGVARGLEYYTGVVFEIYGEGLGAESQVCGGGTYRLIPLFGGPDIPSTGFAIGFDRIMEIYGLEPEKEVRIVLVSTEDTREEGIRIAGVLRKRYKTYLDIMQRGLRSQLHFADRWNADYAVIIGPKEVRDGKVTLRDLESGEQETLTLDDCLEILAQRATA
ncbi:MAG: Histidine-tRNA ligase [Candidatus Syntrophoarchaeum butanivorans]|uniref:Histidine--tRNA ligase n=3 Tax=Candidatus Syntropharchaeum butanivorans TaxID=1839936 RepID=A0A1F2P6E7_9EURY|nr:MAG: Histidine-tRNA ligase [Candidatus Syntrophoarchaeum butanivorans]